MERYLAKVKRHGEALRYVPDKFITEEMCEIAIDHNGIYLYDVPYEMRTEDMCLTAVENNGVALKYVPDEMITYDMCLIAVKNAGMALNYVPKEMITYDLCFSAVENKNKYIFKYYRGLNDRYKHIWSYELYFNMIKHSDSVLKYIPKNIITCEMYFEHIKYRLNFDDIPEEKITEELLNYGFQKHREKIRSIEIYAWNNQFYLKYRDIKTHEFSILSMLIFRYSSILKYIKMPHRSIPFIYQIIHISFLSGVYTLIGKKFIWLFLFIKN